MKTRDKKTTRLTQALLETADDMRRAGIMDEEAYRKITMRHLGPENKGRSEPLSGEDIRAMREQAHMSQAVFAHYLNVSVSYVSQLERGAKRPTGAALALLNVIKRKGIEAILD
ncbi:helix-turn-helix domain-containing protein [Desulfobacca acetoxidans]|uniref:Transcriptional regulator, XRE family n=1 Tax=Desulfobacca acetoxidans (strain ATCC 700848 / DSM 11109 / ASRB2) TaxID=880072 RepID=F2ND93_DESAR|nr:helix-turn-helix domain-containing protein [Desulfobacca acetoxidans]AEB09817.1 transcriptional regulator, XRE family [Desulfobacca acetoxidans DSM 11109]